MTPEPNPTLPPDDKPIHHAAHLLRSESLSIEVMDPVDPERYNRGVRFSPVANVLRACVEGRNFLYSPVEHEPQTENGGLAMEFDITTVGNPPPGFAEAAMGDGFLKVGVGVLRKETEQYNFFKAYEPLALARTAAQWARDTARFKQTCPGVNGYAYKLEANVSAKANAAEVRCVLTNIGQKPLSTEQYSHNYFLFDDAPVGPNYLLQFPFDFDVTGLQPDQRRDGRVIDFAKPFSPGVGSVNAVVIPPAGYQGPNELTVTNPAKGMKCRASASLPIARIAVHATPAYLCPEMFVRIALQPGESREWTRRYEFEIA